MAWRGVAVELPRVAVRWGRGAGWYLNKGEALIVTDNRRCSEGVLEVRCRELAGQPYADIAVEELVMEVELSDERSRWVKIHGLPVTYEDISTVYGDQGSERDHVHLHCERFKPKRNVYTGEVECARWSVRVQKVVGACTVGRRVRATGCV